MRFSHRLAIGAAAALATGILLAPAAAAPSSPRTTTTTVQDVDLTSGVLAVTSSTSHKLDLSVDVDDSSPGASCGTGDTTDTDDLTVTVATPSGRESHMWDFTIPCTDFTPTSGDATVTVPSADIAPFGSMSLTFTETSSATATCPKGTPDMTYAGTLSGSIHFATGSAWGILGGTSPVTFPKPNTLDDSYGCQPSSGAVGSGTQTCASFATYEIDNDRFPLIDASGGSENKQSLGLQAFRISNLTKPADATRFDEIATKVPTPTIKAKGKGEIVTITTKGDSDTGSGTLTANGSPKVSKEACLSGKTRKKETIDDWSKTSYKNGKKPLKIGAEVFGDFSFTSQDHVDLVIARSAES